MSRWSPVYVPEIETGRHVKNNACTVEIKIKWMIRKHMTYENTYRDDKYRISTINRLWMYIKMLNRVKYVTMQHDYCLKLCKWTKIFAYSFARIHDFFLRQVSLL